MNSVYRLRHLVIFAFLVAPLAGCGSGGSTPDTVSTGPPVTEENLKDLSKQINAGGAGMKPPGVSTPKR
ncbi:hypothetical protein V5E97_01715 [Singulisphaera sp. Ch08]|uniref:Lipoprotein n=1 Tax=Singulisphaera sp. Ch08 TaxID=3120278 RepID=A0AAU7CHC8_9BACT